MRTLLDGREHTGNGVKHGMCGTHVYGVWKSMRRRCLSKRHHAYHEYGGRGIFICKRWNDFSSFLEDMGLPPTDSHSLDRIDTNDGYHKKNCRWANAFEQANNRRDNVRLTVDGETKTLSEWSKKLGIRRIVLEDRFWHGWSHDRIIKTPVSRRKKKRCIEDAEKILAQA